MQATQENLVGVGLYTVSEASRLINASSQNIRRWLKGYKYTRNGEDVFMSPVWDKQIPDVDDVVAFGFLDLMELRFVHAFRHHGVSLQVIRLAAERACELFGKHHPFSRRRFRTDGRHIFAEVAEETGESLLLNLVKSQFAFKTVLEPSLYASIEHTSGDDVLRWFPMWPKQSVVIDPARSFGRPIVQKVDMPTDILAQAVKVGESLAAVAKWYDIPIESVRAAVEFEERLAA